MIKKIIQLSICWFLCFSIFSGCSTFHSECDAEPTLVLRKVVDAQMYLYSSAPKYISPSVITDVYSANVAFEHALESAMIKFYLGNSCAECKWSDVLTYNEYYYVYSKVPDNVGLIYLIVERDSNTVYLFLASPLAG